MIWNKNMKQTKVDGDWEMGITTKIFIIIANVGNDDDMHLNKKKEEDIIMI